jgi:hypothetical protein
MKKPAMLAFVIASIIVSSLGLAEAAGTLNVTFKYLDNNGIEQPLKNAYVYLQNGSTIPPMEKFFKQPSYILGPSDSSGSISASAPEGTYYIRITRRNPESVTPLGPPREGDYTWNQTDTITITTNATLNLGTKIATYFFTPPITISGTVKSPYGVPLANRYVRAQPEPCIPADGYNGIPSNMCGRVKYIAKAVTDANGMYTLEMQDPGTYYMYAAPCLGDQHVQYQGNPCMGYSGGTVTVQAIDNKTVNITAY